MATVNLKEVMEAVQKKIYTADSSTSNLQDLIYLLKGAKRGDGTMVQQVASTSSLPDLTDSAADTEMIAFVQDEGKLYFKQDSSGTTVWKTYESPPGNPLSPLQAASNHGYSAMGISPSASPNARSHIERFDFSSSVTSSNIGTLSTTYLASQAAGNSSSTHGFVTGGRTHPTSPLHPVTNLQEIFSFPFAASSSGTDVGNLTDGNALSLGNTSSPTHGYIGGATKTGSLSPPYPSTDVVSKYPFSSPHAESLVGDLTQGRYLAAGCSSADNVYWAGGGAPGTRKTIDKIPVTTDANATDVGDLIEGHRFGASASSSTHGYTSAGLGEPDGPSNPNAIEKFSFASDGNATDVGDVTQTNNDASQGWSGGTHGYRAGGSPSVNYIDRWAFASDGNATDVGDQGAQGYEYQTGHSN